MGACRSPGPAHLPDEFFVITFPNPLQAEGRLQSKPVTSSATRAGYEGSDLFVIT